MSGSRDPDAALVWRGRLVAYVAVGAAAAGVFMLVSQLAHAALGLALVPAAALGFGVSLVPAYIGHRQLTFRSSGRKSVEVPRFVASSLLCFGLTLACTHLFVSRLGLPSLTALALTSVVVPVLNFALLAGFVFVRRAGTTAQK